MQSHTDGTNIITTASAAAAVLYARGVECLIRSSPDAGDNLRAAVRLDSHLAVAFAALAVAAASHELDSERDASIACALAEVHGTTRRERQHVEIVALVLSGDISRAGALRAAHLAEFPLDSLIGHLLDPVEP